MKKLLSGALISQKACWNIAFTRGDWKRSELKTWCWKVKRRKLEISQFNEMWDTQLILNKIEFWNAGREVTYLSCCKISFLRKHSVCSTSNFRHANISLCKNWLKLYPLYSISILLGFARETVRSTFRCTFFPSPLALHVFLRYFLYSVTFFQLRHKYHKVGKQVSVVRVRARHFLFLAKRYSQIFLGLLWVDMLMVGDPKRD